MRLIEPTPLNEEQSLNTLLRISFKKDNERLKEMLKFRVISSNESLEYWEKYIAPNVDEEDTFEQIDHRILGVHFVRPPSVSSWSAIVSKIEREDAQLIRTPPFKAFRVKELAEFCSGLRRLVRILFQLYVRFLKHIKGSPSSQDLNLFWTTAEAVMLPPLEKFIQSSKFEELSQIPENELAPSSEREVALELDGKILSSWVNVTHLLITTNLTAYKRPALELNFSNYPTFIVGIGKILKDLEQSAASETKSETKSQPKPEYERFENLLFKKAYQKFAKEMKEGFASQGASIDESEIKRYFKLYSDYAQLALYADFPDCLNTVPKDLKEYMITKYIPDEFEIGKVEKYRLRRKEFPEETLTGVDENKQTIKLKPNGKK